jgi:hypothetical protein
LEDVRISKQALNLRLLGRRATDWKRAAVFCEAGKGERPKERETTTTTTTR